MATTIEDLRQQLQAAMSEEKAMSDILSVAGDTLERLEKAVDVAKTAQTLAHRHWKTSSDRVDQLTELLRAHGESLL